MFIFFFIFQKKDILEPSQRTMTMKIPAIFLTTCCLLPLGTLGFSPVITKKRWTRFQSDSSLFVTNNDNTDFIRQQLENVLPNDDAVFDIKILLAQVNATRTMDEIELPVAPPLTSIERIFREQEIELLEQLGESDAPLTNLRRLWNSERGGGSVLNPDECNEEMLLNIIQEYGVYFVQPVHLLAKLYARQGRHAEARFLWTKIVLAIKPWHVDGLRGVIKTCVKLRDSDAAREFAEQSLPDLISSSSSAPFAGGCVNPKRKEWTKKHVEKARQSWTDAEERTLLFFAEEQDAWQ